MLIHLLLNAAENICSVQRTGRKQKSNKTSEGVDGVAERDDKEHSFLGGLFQAEQDNSE